MSDIAIKVENLSKLYRLHEGRKGSISETIAHQLNKLLKHGEHSSDDDFWALKDLSFEVKRGEVVGVIGKNGAGKSTLLKILSRITVPTTGRVEINGRISSLLEVGTGFHPELTGRENIFLNGTILGMKRSEVKSKLDQIVAFSGIENFIDTPVKRYSSGMYVRLAFSVAAHLNTEILIIDEVLAVGDVEFQKKCLGKMSDVAGQGTTVLFVSHQMAAVRQLCSKAILLSKGQLKFQGSTEETIEQYLMENETIGDTAELHWPDPSTAPGSKEFTFTFMKLLNHKGEACNDFDIAYSITLEIGFTVNEQIQNLRLGMHLLGPDQTYAFVTAHIMEEAKPGNYIVRCTIPENLLNVNTYHVVAGAGIAGVIDFTKTQTYFKFTTFDTQKNGMLLNERWPGLVKPRLRWDLKMVN